MLCIVHMRVRITTMTWCLAGHTPSVDTGEQCGCRLVNLTVPDECGHQPKRSRFKQIQKLKEERRRDERL